MDLNNEVAKQLRIRYIRKQNGDKKGVMVAQIQGDKVMIGFSLCNSRDRWNVVKGKREKNFGLEVALSRAEKYHSRSFGSINIPNSLVEPLETFVFKLMVRHTGKEFPEWTKEFVERSKLLAERAHELYLESQDVYCGEVRL